MPGCECGGCRKLEEECRKLEEECWRLLMLRCKCGW